MTRTAASGLDPRDRTHLTASYDADRTLCNLVVGVKWNRMTDWEPTPGVSVLCTRCAKAESKAATQAIRDRNLANLDADKGPVVDEGATRRAGQKTCSVVVSATGDRCGKPAVEVRESMFGGSFAECADHVADYIKVAASDIGKQVEISWHSWPKPGEVVEERERSVDVRFVPKVGAQPIVRRFDRDAVRGL